MRDYVLSWELKRARLDWKNWLLTRWGMTGTRLLVAQLKADPSFRTQAERVRLDQRLRLGVEIPMKKCFTALVHDARIHPLRVQVDATVQFVLLHLESHVTTPPGENGKTEPERQAQKRYTFSTQWRHEQCQ